MGRPPKMQAEAPKLGKIKLLRNYRPAGDFTIGGEEPTELEREKVKAGAEIELPIEEAREVIRKGIGIRNDEF